MTKAQVLWCLCLVSMVVGDLQVLSTSERLYHVDTVSKLNNEASSATALQLALDSIGCPSTFVPNEGISIQADVFHHPEAFLLILADSSQVNPLNSIVAKAHHKLPMTNAIELQQIRSEIETKCAEKGTIVSSSIKPELETSIWTEYSELNPSDPNDVAFVRELTAVASFRPSIVRSAKAKDIYIVSFTNLRALSNRQVVSSAIEKEMAKLFTALATQYSTVGVQSIASDFHQPLTAVARRHLQENNTNATAPPKKQRRSRRELLTFQDIADYQITLWIAVSLILIVLITTCAMCNMNLGRDSLLYATFLTEASHRKVN